MVAAHQDGGDAGAVEPGDLPGEEQADRRVDPVAVVDVAGHDHEGHGALDRAADQILEGLPPGRGQPARQFGIPGSEAGQRAAEMQVRRVDEAEARHRPPEGLVGTSGHAGEGAVTALLSRLRGTPQATPTFSPNGIPSNAPAPHALERGGGG